MIILPIRTSLIKAGDNIVHILSEQAEIQDGDIVVLSSKAVATAEGAAINLKDLSISEEAKDWSSKTGRSAEFMETVLQETARLHGIIRGHCPGALLTDLKPEGMIKGTIFAPNAGLDESNIDVGWAVGWPLEPVTSGKQLQMGLNKNCAVIIGDSCLRPRRLGVTAFALTACGIDPLRSEIGHQDLFGRELRVTVEAVADQLTTAANFVMGNANQCTPAAIIREHDIVLTQYNGWVEGMEPERDLFRSIL